MKRLLMITMLVSLILLLGISVNAYAEKKSYLNYEASSSYLLPRDAANEAAKQKAKRFMIYDKEIEYNTDIATRQTDTGDNSVSEATRSFTAVAIDDASDLLDQDILDDTTASVPDETLGGNIIIGGGSVIEPEPEPEIEPEPEPEPEPETTTETSERPPKTKIDIILK